MAWSTVVGARMMINLKQNLSYRLRMGIGKGSNIKVDLLALWGLLSFAYEKDMLSLTILGDSKVIVDWDNNIHILHTKLSCIIGLSA